MTCEIGGRGAARNTGGRPRAWRSTGGAGVFFIFLIIKPAHADEPAWPDSTAQVLPDASDASTSDSVQAQAARHYARGVALERQGAFAEAIAEFLKAYEQHPHPTVLFNLGQTAIAAGRHADAHRYLSRYLAEAEVAVAPARRKQIANQLRELEARTAALEISADPAGSEIQVDGQPVGTTPLAAAVRLDGGVHGITARRAGYLSTTATATLRVGERERLHIVLHAAPDEQREARLGWLVISCPSTPAQVLLDGQVVTRTPGESTLTVPAGAHQIEFRPTTGRPALLSVQVAALAATAVPCPWSGADDGAGVDAAPAPYVRRGAVVLWITGGLLTVTSVTLAVWNGQRQSDWQARDRALDELQKTAATTEQHEGLRVGNEENNRLARSIGRTNDWVWVTAASAGAALLAGTALYFWGARVAVGPEPSLALKIEM